ncbi:MAG: hypothetical protein ACR2IE_12100 [Candidatus Sumerlaeaceae bacterium]
MTRLALFSAVVLTVLALAPCAFAQTHGSAEFASSGTWTPPKGVKLVTVELWGAGGNGGLGDSSGGGGGGGAGYARGLVSIKGKQTFLVTVGDPSTATRRSAFTNSLNVDLISAEGGGDGTNGTLAFGGNGGNGGQGLPATMLTRGGNGGSGGSGGPGGPGGPGGSTARGSVDVGNAGQGGDGGHGSGSPAANSGGSGHVILSW